MLLKIQSAYLFPLLCKVVCQIAKIYISYFNPVVLSSYFYVFNCTNFCGLVSCIYCFFNILKFLHILLLRLFLKFVFEMQKLFYRTSNMVQFKADILLRWFHRVLQHIKVFLFKVSRHCLSNMIMNFQMSTPKAGD